mmetsp:Transcript_15969/g.17840  ORF Transcript_15969/g.17840 Transcript_15969/m.17840 type:complete len:390 (-) Transcript_15969:140-1309(-)
MVAVLRSCWWLLGVFGVVMSGVLGAEMASVPSLGCVEEIGRCLGLGVDRFGDCVEGLLHEYSSDCFGCALRFGSFIPVELHIPETVTVEQAQCVADALVVYAQDCDSGAMRARFAGCFNANAHTDDCMDEMAVCSRQYFQTGDRDAYFDCVNAAIEDYSFETCLPSCSDMDRNIMSSNKSPFIANSSEVIECLVGCDRELFRSCFQDSLIYECYAGCFPEPNESQIDQCQQGVLDCYGQYLDHSITYEEFMDCSFEMYSEYGYRACFPCYAENSLQDIFSQVPSVQIQDNSRENECRLDCYDKYMNDCNYLGAVDCQMRCPYDSVQTEISTQQSGVMEHIPSSCLNKVWIIVFAVGCISLFVGTFLYNKKRVEGTDVYDQLIASNQVTL